MRIVTVGVLPPPVGGVSSFVKRFHEYLVNEGIDSTVFDISRVDKRQKKGEHIICTNFMYAFFKLTLMRPSLIIFHSVNPLAIIGAFFLTFRHKVVIFIHNERQIFQTARCWWLRKCLSRMNFLVPTSDIQQQIYARIPEMRSRVNVQKFVLFSHTKDELSDYNCKKLRERCDLIFGVYAFKLVDFKEVDLYGLDMAIEMIRYLRNQGYNPGLIMLLPDVTNKVKYNNIVARIQSYNLENSVAIINRKLEDASVLYKFIDVYLRPTNTDGDAFSIWEALYVHTPVLASDATPRPDGCLLFKTRDQDALNTHAREMMENYDFYKENTKKILISGNEKEILKNLLG